MNYYEKRLFGGEVKPEKLAGAERVKAVYEHYRKHHPRKPSTVPANDRMKILSRMKEGFSVEDLQQAIDGCHHTPFNAGDNETGQTYQSLDLIFRNSDKVTQFIEYEQKYRAKEDQTAPAKLPEGAVGAAPGRGVNTPDGRIELGKWGGYLIPKQGIWEYTDEHCVAVRKVYPRGEA